MKRNKLIIQYEYSFELIGITSSVKFYKLAWAINNALKIDLIKQDDYELDFLENPPSFENFSYTDNESQLWLFKNRSVNNDSQYLLPEYPHFDYLIKIPSESQSFAVKEISKVLREVNLIEYIGALEVETLKSRDNFLE